MAANANAHASPRAANSAATRQRPANIRLVAEPQQQNGTNRQRAQKVQHHFPLRASTFPFERG
jgi:hypothetical protein